jgi:hypothetical protein
MKTTPLATVATIAAILTLGILSLNYYLTPKPNIEITNFNTTGTSSGSSYDVVHVGFVLNLTNTGTGDATDLTVTFSTNTTHESNKQLTYTNSTPPYDHIAEIALGQPCHLGGLKAGETKDFLFYWAVSIDFNAPPVIATLKSNQAILDQATVTVPTIPNVKITNFICLGNWHGTRLGGLLDLFSLSYTNLGMADVKDVTVTLNTSKTTENYRDPYNRTSIPGYDPYDFLDETINGKTYTLESLKAKETKTFEKSYLDTGFLLIEPFALTITLKFNDIIVDQATRLIPISG